MKEQKHDWVKIGGIIGIVVIVVTVIIYGITNPVNADTQYERYKFVTIEQYYDDNNTFTKIVCDPETKVLYAIIDGRLITPFYNADGTLRTAEPEE